MRLLCLETSTGTARVGVMEGGAAGPSLLAAAEATADRHSANVLRLVDEVLRRAALRPAELGGVACGGGPGSFTGLRVGLSVAKGLALAGDLPLILVPSLQTLAEDIAAAYPAARAVPCIDAGKGEVYAALDAAQFLQPWRLPPVELAARLADAGACVVAGNGADRHAEALDAALPPGARRAQVAGPSAGSVGRLAFLRHAAGEMADLATAVPLYGRPPDITTPKR